MQSQKLKASGRDPFAAAAGAYFPSRTHEAAVAQAEYVIKAGLGAALVVGPRGCGKTVVVDRVCGMLPASRFKLVRTNGAGLRGTHLMKRLATGCLAPPAPEGEELPGTLASMFSEEMEFCCETDITAVLVIDDLHLCRDPAALEDLRLFLGYPGGRAAALLTGGPELSRDLRDRPGLEQHVAISAVLSPLPYEEIGPYVAHKLRAAGFASSLFASDAVDAIASRSRGICREIDRLCAKVVVMAASRGVDTVTGALVESAANISEAMKDSMAAVPVESLQAGGLCQKLIAESPWAGAERAGHVEGEILWQLREEVHSVARSREEEAALLKEILEAIRGLRGSVPAKVGETEEGGEKSAAEDRIPFDALDKVIDRVRREQEDMG